MNCREFEELLGEHLDGELAGEQLAAFEQHRRECALCTLLLEGVKENLALFQDFPEMDPPPRLAQRILAATQQPPRRGWTRFLDELLPRQGLWPRLAVAAIVLLFVVSLAYNFVLQPPADAAGLAKDQRNLVSMVDYTGSRALTRAVRVYESVQETWDAAIFYKDRVNNFFQSHWEQVKDVFNSDEKKKKSPEPGRREMNQSLQTRTLFPKTA